MVQYKKQTITNGENIKINETIYGFLVKRAVEIKDAGATLYEAEHIKSGARLLFFDREDENKTFSIAFKTIPEDSTGVFHIIEHSVLCGSKSSSNHIIVFSSVPTICVKSFTIFPSSVWVINIYL